MDGVVVLHGIFRTYRSMGKLAKFLEKKGYRVLNLGYPSTRQPLENLIDHIHPEIEKFSESIDGKLHFVGYSMGGLLIRAYIAKYRQQRLGRVVMLGTPNKGSEVADFLKNNPLYKTFYGPAGQQLVTTQEEFNHIFGTIDYELGIIAGDSPIDPISSRIIGKPNDGKVSIESTRIEGMKDHVVVPSSHTFFPTNQKAWECTAQFLAEGCFNNAPYS